MEKKTRKIDLNNILLPLFWAFILVLCVFVLSSTVNAATGSNGELPYNVPDFRGANNVIPDLAIEMARDRAIDTIQNYYGYTGDISFIMFTNDGIINNYIYDVMVIPMPSINYNIAPTSNYRESAYFVTANYVPMFRVGVLLNFDHTERNLNAGNGANLCGSVATSELNGETFTPRYPFYMYGIEELSSTNGTVIFTNIQPVNIPLGHATQPINNPENIINGLDGHKIQKPTFPTINNYSWTTYNNPPIDTSTVETLLESIFDSMVYNFSYLFTNLGGLFANLINNIGDLIEFVVDSIYYAVNNIVSAIQDFATDFYNNMVSLFEPIAENIKTLREKIEEFADLFIHPFDEEEFEEQIENSSFMTNYHAIVDNCEVLEEIIDYAEERDHFSLYISFENPLDNSVHRIISSEISFDWLVPLRSVYRPFLWVCVLIELFVGGARVLTHALGGHGV